MLFLLFVSSTLSSNPSLHRWCRLEQWAAMAANGQRMGHMLLFTEAEGLVKLDQQPGWLQESLRVFDGQFSKCSLSRVLPLPLNLKVTSVRRTPQHAARTA